MTEGNEEAQMNMEGKELCKWLCVAGKLKSKDRIEKKDGAELGRQKASWSWGRKYLRAGVDKGIPSKI